MHLTLTMWVNADTYLPIQSEVPGLRDPEQGLHDVPVPSPTQANLALLQPPVPGGFQQVSPPDNGMLPYVLLPA
jgi:hypothetical protein